MAATVYYNGDIVTMKEDSVTKAERPPEAVVEQGGKIAFVGSLARAKSAYPKAAMIDLKGRCMMPGHIDPHLHPSMAALILSMHFITPFDWNLPSGKYQGVQTEEGYQTRLRKLIDDNFAEYSQKPTELLITWGYHTDFHGDMSRSVIDGIDTGKSDKISVVVWHRSFHEAYLNSFAMQNLVYQDLDALKQNGQVDWDKGHFYEMGLDALIATTSFGEKIMPLMENGYQEMVKVVNQNGVTTIGDLEFPMIDEGQEKTFANKYLKSEGAFFSTYSVPSSRNFGRDAGGDHQKAIQMIKDVSAEMSNDQFHVYTDHVKCLIDGAFYSQAMQMKPPGYFDGHEGEWIMPPEELAPAMEVYWKNGFQIHIHTNGDLGMEKLLEIVEDLMTKHPRENHKTTVEHAGFFNRDQAKKMKRLGMIASTAPYYFYTLSDKYAADDVLGKERAHAIAPMRYLFDQGITTAFHSDFTMAPSQPLLLAWTAINRITSNLMVHRDDLCCSVYEGMLAITKNAAKILGTEGTMGSIEQGKLANFTILDHNPLKVFPPMIRDIRINASVYKGKVNIINP